MPIPKTRWEIAPGNACTKTIQNRFYEKPIVFGSHPNMTVTTRQTKALKTFPLLVTKSVSLFHAPYLTGKDKCK